MNAVLGFEHRRERPLIPAIEGKRRVVRRIELRDKLPARETGNPAARCQPREGLLEIAADLRLKLELALLRGPEFSRGLALSRLFRSPLQGNLEGKGRGVAGRSVVALNGPRAERHIRIPGLAGELAFVRGAADFSGTGEETRIGRAGAIKQSD